MADNPEVKMRWSGTFVAKWTRALPGDKMILPPSALEQLLQAAPTVSTSNGNGANFDPFNPYPLAAARQQALQWGTEQAELPHPLTFRLVSGTGSHVVYAGVREFSGNEGEIVLSTFLAEALGVEFGEIDVDEMVEEPTKADFVTLHLTQLPKGTYVRLRPLEAGYDPDDWKALLERHLRDNYTTLTINQILRVPDRSRNGRDFQFEIDKFMPEGDGICIVDTDLEVDIEALNEEQARETMKQIMAKSRQPNNGQAEGSSTGGPIDVWKPVDGQVLSGGYVDYELSSWDRTQGLEVELRMDEEDDLDLFLSPLTPRQRAAPRADEHVFGDSSNAPVKRFRLKSSNIELEGAESLYISIHSDQATARDAATPYTLRARIIPNSECDKEPSGISEQEKMPGPGEERCKNCHQIVPKRTMMLHENFCLRNNVLCPKCDGVFRKEDFKDHWHCELDSAHGNHAKSLEKHNRTYHEAVACPSCNYQAQSTPDLAQHRTTVCPGKLIHCRFCHLSVPQEGDPKNPSAEELLSGLTAHELADGGRTTNCHLCNAIVRLRDMDTHLKHHEMNKVSKPVPRLCRNVNCGRTLGGMGKNGQPLNTNGNELGLCGICYGPLYVSMHDPEGKAMKRRIERRYLSQLISGCGKSWCANTFCKSGKLNLGRAKPGDSLTARDALPLIQPLLPGTFDLSTPMYFCVDEASQTGRKRAEMMAGEGMYEFEWCIAALRAENGDTDSARQWLQNWAPKKATLPLR